MYLSDTYPCKWKEEEEEEDRVGVEDKLVDNARALTN